MENCVEIKELNETTLVLKLNGILDENVDLSIDCDFSKFEKLYVDFSRVAFINSSGIKNWVNFSEKLGSYSNLEVRYEKCNRMVVDQINKVVGFASSNAKVYSIYAPIFCDKCEASFEVLLDSSQADLDQTEIFAQIDEASCQKFPGCKKYWELDFFKDDYLKCLKTSE